ncbi:MAG TPA: M23 family metallopeptidase [Oculatellaceae cyanobacterium]
MFDRLALSRARSTFVALAAAQALWSLPLPAHSAIEVSSRNVRQGDTIEISLTDASATSDNSAGANTSAVFNGNNYKFFAVSGKPDTDGTSTTKEKALLAVPADLDPGKYPLKVGDETISLTVRAGLFPLQHIRLAPSKDNFDTSAGEEEAVDKAKATLSDERMWSGRFSAPSKARTSTGFGLKRMVNGRLLKDYFHSGLDFSGALGSPITACAGGKVILVGRGFKLHGNTVAIDHGQGVVSFYIHMNSIKVKEGELVKQGQTIGTVGQTGRATGPHLHFSIYVNKVAANPSNWFASSF